MFDKENGVGAAHLQAEGLEGVLNITKTIAEILSELAQRNIKVEDLIIQTDKGTLQEGMNPADAERYELDIRDVFMNPENKKNFRVFIEDPEGNRTLLFQSEGGKVNPDIHNLRNAMMLYYAKADAEAMGQNFEPYFEEMVIKTGSADKDSTQLGASPDLAPTGPTVDTEALPDASTESPDLTMAGPDLGGKTVSEPNDAETAAQLYSHVGPNTEAMFLAANEENISQSAQDMFPAEQTQQDRNEAFILQSAIASNRDFIDEQLTEATALIEEYQTIKEIPVDEFVSEVQSVTEAITQMQEQVTSAAGGLAVSNFDGSQFMESWSKDISEDLAQNLPDISTQVKTLAISLVESIKERALNDISILKELASEKITNFSEAVEEKLSDFKESVEEKVGNFKENVEQVIEGFKEKLEQSVGQNRVDHAIYGLVFDNSDTNQLQGDQYTLDVSGDKPEVRRNEDGATIYANGSLTSDATKEDAKAIRSLPSLAAEQSESASKTGGMKR